MERGQLLAALESLKSHPIETSVLNATVSNLWYSLSQAVLSIENAYKDAEENGGRGLSELGKHANQVHDVVQLAKRHVVKLTSKSDMVEVLTKRSKVLEDELYNIERRLSAMRSSVASKASPTSKKVSATVNFTVFVDILDSIDLLLHLRQSITMKNDGGAQEYISPIGTLVDFLNGQCATQPCQAVIWPLDALFKRSMQEVRDCLHLRESPPDGDSEPTSSRSTGDQGFCTGFGKAHRAIWQGLPVLVKTVSPSAFHRSELGLREALSIMETNSRYLKESPFLISVVGVSWTPDYSTVYLISPLAPNLSLYDAFSNPSIKPEHRLSLNPAQKASILHDVTMGIAHLHRHGVVHSRLKDSNVLLFDGYRAKLSDFGVQPFLSNATRFACRGMHGIRWQPPEVVQCEHRLASCAQPDAGQIPTLESIAAVYPYAMSTTTDIYAIGLIAMVLLTESPPFANVPWDEGVEPQLLLGHVPMLPTRYKEKDSMGFLEDRLVKPCMSLWPYDRPSSDAVEKLSADSLLTVLRAEDEKELKDYSATVITVQQEIEALEKKISEHEVLVQKGRDLIAKKDMEKRKATDSKVKREKEVEIERAKTRMATFEDELQGLIDDKDGAESDLVELFALCKELQDRIGRSQEEILADRPQASIAFPITAQTVASYFTVREAELFSAELQPSLRQDSPSVDDAIDLSQIRSFIWPPSVLAQSPFAHTYNPIRDLSDEQLQLLHQRIAQKSSPYQHLVDDLDLIFRVPINAKALKSHGQSIYIQNVVRTPTSAPAHVSPGLPGMALEIASRQTAAPGTHFPPSSAAASTFVPPQFGGEIDLRTISVMSDMNTNIHRLQRETGVIDSDDDDEAELQSSSRMHSKRPSVAQRYSLYHGTSMGPGPSMTDDAAGGAAGTAGAEEGKAAAIVLKHITRDAVWELEISPPMTSGNDQFPQQEVDVIHVQYLAACRGDWAEAVGLRRHEQGLSDESVADYLDRQVSPLHLAAMLGNLAIFQDLVTNVGLVAMSLDHEGSTPLHYACMRGHCTIVRYLCEDLGFHPDVVNNKGMTPILYALKGGFLEIVEYLIEQCPQQIPPTYEDNQLGASLLHWACLSCNLDLISYLLYEQNISVEKMTGVDQSTPLLWASFASSKDVVQFLIEKAQARRDVRNGFSQTCLHMATLSGDADKTTYLMDVAGLKITDKDANHQTPFDVAEGAARILLQERKKKGFVTGSIAEKMRKPTQASPGGGKGGTEDAGMFLIG